MSIIGHIEICRKRPANSAFLSGFRLARQWQFERGCRATSTNGTWLSHRQALTPTAARGMMLSCNLGNLMKRQVETAGINADDEQPE
jgi:hypothetical protein